MLVVLVVLQGAALLHGTHGTRPGCSRPVPLSHTEHGRGTVRRSLHRRGHFPHLHSALDHSVVNVYKPNLLTGESAIMHISHKPADNLTIGGVAWCVALLFRLPVATDTRRPIRARHTGFPSKTAANGVASYSEAIKFENASQHFFSPNRRLQMSSDEGGPTSPALPRDSDRGSSVSSELQDEYEELLRFAVVTPRFEGQPRGPQQGPPQGRLAANGEAWRSHGKDDMKSPRRAAGVIHNVGEDMRSRAAVRTSPQIVDTHSQPSVTYVEELTGQSSGELSDRSRAAAERSRQTSPDSWGSGGTERFISEENLSKMEDILDTWSNHLKSNVLTELRRWRQALVEQHKLDLRKERERCAAQAAGLSAELGDLKELLRTYETSNQRKDEVIMNLSKALDRQKEKLEAMRAFTTWRIQHSQAKEEAHAAKMAQQHYHLQLKRKVWLGWHGLVQKHWKDKVERACRARAEEVCVHLSADYEARIARHCDAVEEAQAEIQKLRMERERYEESMKTAFMRGVCALNMEALNMFHPAEGRPEPSPATAHHHHLHHHQHDAPPPPDEHGSSSLAQQQERPVSSTRFSPVHFDPPAHPSHPSHPFHPSHPSHSEAGLVLGSSAPVTRPEASTTVIHSSLPLGGTASTHRQASGGRVVTSGVVPQKPSKTVTARVTARPDLSRTGRSSLHVMSMTPPMSSVIVERHHPVTQLNIGQSVAASKHPPLAHLGHSLPATRGQSSSSRPHPSTCHVHSIKVVD
ncbi:Centrosomal protein POC5 [Merluccius polli]|uniref:Centrosomal protein POC5 n=1 Tax=Merluccius polli TaxID=89951 RepID=A0AA47MPJ7_MERPO|nr:Centrosomal protein POC5 [Merluccius polli]